MLKHISTPDGPDLCVVVRGVCDGAGLHQVAGALLGAVLALELVAALHLRGLTQRGNVCVNIFCLCKYFLWTRKCII